MALGDHVKPGTGAVNVDGKCRAPSATIDACPSQLQQQGDAAPSSNFVSTIELRQRPPPHRIAHLAANRHEAPHHHRGDGPLRPCR